MTEFPPSAPSTLARLDVNASPVGDKREKRAHLLERDELDWYVEPSWITTGLLRAETFTGVIWDPACGGGNILEACRAAGYSVIGTDVVDRGAVMNGLIDFEDYDGPALAPNIIMNPPYFRARGAEVFIRKAIEVVGSKADGGKVAAFVDHRFIAGKERATGLFREWPPTRIWQVTPRPSCPPGKWLEAGNKAGGGTADYVWLIWELSDPRKTTHFGWLRCER